MATVGEATIKLKFDGNSLSASAKEETPKITNALSKLGSAAKVTGKVIGVGLAAGYGIASVAMKKFGVESVKQYANYEQLAGGIKKLYGDSANEFMQYANDAFKNAQLSATEYMETATSFSASLIQGLGGDTQKAAAYANRAIESMADNANTFGTDMELLQNAYKGFAKQNYMMLDNLQLGYGGTKTEMQRLIKDASKMKTEMKKLGVSVDESSMSFDNIVNAIAVVQEHMKIAGTSANEATETISGSFNMLRSSLANLITGFADPTADLDKLMDNVFESFEAFASQAAPAFERAIKGIAKVLPKLVQELGKMLPELLQEILPALVEATVALLVALADAIPIILPVLVDGLIKLVEALVPYLPTIFFTLLQAIVQLVAGLFVSLVKMTATFLGDIFAKIGEWFGQIGPKIAERMGEIWNGLKEGAKNAWEGVKTIFGNVANFFGSVFSKAWEAVKKVFSTGGKIFDGIKQGIVNAFKTIVNAIIRGINKVVAIPFNAINGVLNGIRSIDIFGAKPFEWIGTINVPQIPELAQGGVANNRSLATIGEAGKEAVIPLERNTENWAGPLASALAKQFLDEDMSIGRDITVYMTNNINNNLDADEIGRRLMTSIRRAS